MSWGLWGEQLRDEEKELKTEKAISEAPALVKKIRDLKDKGTQITISEAKLLKESEDKLHSLQKGCSHFYSVILLFNRHCKFCKWCDHEDTTYRHEG